MDNTKSFKDNYKYNAKKVLEIIENERLKRENKIKAEIKKQDKEKE